MSLLVVVVGQQTLRGRHGHAPATTTDLVIMPLPRQAFAPLRAFVRSSASRQRCLRGLEATHSNAIPSLRAFSSSVPQRASALADHSSRQAGSGHPPTRSSRLLHAPSERDLQEAEIEAEVLPVHEATFQMTDAAAQVSYSTAWSWRAVWLNARFRFAFSNFKQFRAGITTQASLFDCRRVRRLSRIPISNGTDF